MRKKIRIRISTFLIVAVFVCGLWTFLAGVMLNRMNFSPLWNVNPSKFCGKKRQCNWKTLRKIPLHFGTCDYFYREILDWDNMLIRHFIGKFEISKDTKCDHAPSQITSTPPLDDFGDQLKRTPPVVQQKSFDELFEMINLWSILADDLDIMYSVVAGLIGGMCLGGSNLPWDDDLDVVISRADADKLRHVYFSESNDTDFDGQEYRNGYRRIQMDKKGKGKGKTLLLRGRFNWKNLEPTKFFIQIWKEKYATCAKTVGCCGFVEVLGCDEKELKTKNGKTVRYCAYGKQMSGQEWGVFSSQRERIDELYPKVDMCGLKLRVFRGFLGKDKDVWDEEKCFLSLYSNYEYRKGGMDRLLKIMDSRHKSINTDLKYDPVFSKHIKTAKANLKHIRKYLNEEEKAKFDEIVLEAEDWRMRYEGIYSKLQKDYSTSLADKFVRDAKEKNITLWKQRKYHVDWNVHELRDKSRKDKKKKNKKKLTKNS